MFKTVCPNCDASCTHEDMTQSVLQIPHKKDCPYLQGKKTMFNIQDLAMVS